MKENSSLGLLFEKNGAPLLVVGFRHKHHANVSNPGEVHYAVTLSSKGIIDEFGPIVHRDECDGPAMIEKKTGVVHWIFLGTHHRVGGPAFTVHSRGIEKYYLNGTYFESKELWETVKKKMTPDTSAGT